MNNQYHNPFNINFSNIELYQYIELTEDNVNKFSKKELENVETLYNNTYILSTKHKIPSDNLLLEYIKLKYYGNPKVYLTTPLMRCVFGVEKSFKNFEIKLAFHDIDNDKTIKQFYDTIKTCEYTQMAQIGLKANESNKYISQIRQDKDKKYDPYLIVKLPFRYNKFEIDLVYKDSSDLGIMDITGGMMMRCNIYIDTIQKFNGKYICKWKCSFIQI